MEKLQLSQVQDHFKSLRQNKVGTYSKHDVRTAIEDHFLQEFANELFQTRLGLSVHKKSGTKMPAKDLSFVKAVESFFGADLKSFMTSIGIDSGRMSFAQINEMFGGGVLGKTKMEDLLCARLDYGSDASSFAGGTGGVSSTKDFPSDYRFIIPEIFAAAIRIGYDGSAMNSRWTAMTQPMANMQLTMPQILRGDAMPSKVAEGGSIPVGSVKFGKKSVEVFKVGTGFIITDELMQQSTIDMVMQFMQEVGIEMGIGADVEAMRVLISGEQADGSEAAPIVGVGTTSTISYVDLKRIFTRMRRLRNEASLMITSETDNIAITGIDRFEGFQGETKLASIGTIVGVPDRFEIDTHVLPANQSLFLSPTRAMAKLQYKSMTMERKRNPQTQTDEMYVTDYVGFAILRNDARVIMDKSLAFSSNGFPASMDIDARIATAFNEY